MWCPHVSRKMNADSLRYPRARRNPLVIKELYQEWWFFEVLDVAHDLKFMANCSINNPANLDGPLPRGCDIASAIIVGQIMKSTSKEDSFMTTFEASAASLDVNIGNSLFFKGIDDARTRLWGTDPGTGVTVDLMFAAHLPAWKERKTHVGNRFLDVMWYLPAMPSATVNGTIRFDGNEYLVKNGVGYHDHFWGSPTQFRWSPWVTVNHVEFEVISVTIPTKHDFAGACIDTKRWIELGRPTFKPISWKMDAATSFNYPASFAITSESKNYRLEMDVRENGNHASFDGGMGEYKCPIIWSWNYEASGTIFKKERGTWTEKKHFDATPASVYYFDNFDFVALAKQAGIDISEYERFLK